MSNLKALWINSGPFNLNDNIQAKIRKDLTVDEILITECQSEELAQHLNGGYDYFIITVNREDLVQEMYDMLNEHGKVMVLSIKKVEAADDHDWETYPPCGTRYIVFSKLLIPIVQDGIITGVE